VGPILVVGPNQEDDQDLPGRLLVCVDPESPATELLDAAATWQETFGGTAELFEAVIPAPARAAAAVGPPVELQNAHALLPAAGVTYAESHDPVEAILDAARAPNSVIALGTNLRRGIERAVLGSVAWEVVRLSTTPVLIVPNEGRSKDVASMSANGGLR
jgi:nucleotide-binding universal stress UspA family protein